MWLTVHATCGAALAHILSDSPVIVGLAALGSHAILDHIPHWDYPANPLYVAVDLLIALSIVATASQGSRMVWMGAFMASVPDLEHVLSYYGYLSPEKTLHSRLSLKPLVELSFPKFWKVVVQPFLLLILWRMFTG